MKLKHREVTELAQETIMQHSLDVVMGTFTVLHCLSSGRDKRLFLFSFVQVCATLL